MGCSVVRVPPLLLMLPQEPSTRDRVRGDRVPAATLVCHLQTEADADGGHCAGEASSWGGAVLVRKDAVVSSFSRMGSAAVGSLRDAVLCGWAGVLLHPGRCGVPGAHATPGAVLQDGERPAPSPPSYASHPNRSRWQCGGVQ